MAKKTQEVKTGPTPYYKEWEQQAAAEGRRRLDTHLSIKLLQYPNPDKPTQMRVVERNLDHVRDLHALLVNGTATDLTPIEVIHDKECDEWYVCDGHHRLEAYVKDGRKEIPAYVTDGTYEEALKYACSCNERLCLPRTKEDRKKATETLLLQPQNANIAPAKVGAIVGATPFFVSKIRDDLVVRGLLKQQTHLMTSKGRLRNCRTRNGHPRVRCRQKDKLAIAKQIFLYWGKASSMKNYPNKRAALEDIENYFYTQVQLGALGFKPTIQRNPNHSSRWGGRFESFWARTGGRNFRQYIPVDSTAEQIESIRAQLQAEVDQYHDQFIQDRLRQTLDYRDDELAKLEAEEAEITLVAQVNQKRRNAESERAEALAVAEAAAKNKQQADRENNKLKLEIAIDRKQHEDHVAKLKRETESIKRRLRQEQKAREQAEQELKEAKASGVAADGIDDLIEWISNLDAESQENLRNGAYGVNPAMVWGDAVTTVGKPKRAKVTA